MPKVYKVLSAKEIIKILEDFNFRVKSQSGSHIKMSHTKLSAKSSEEVIVMIPNHKEIREGTMRSIRRQASGAVSLEDLDRYFKN